MNERMVRLPEDAWQRVLQILATAAWAQANPLIMAIGEQLAAQAPKPNGAAVEAAPVERAN